MRMGSRMGVRRRRIAACSYETRKCKLHPVIRYKYFNKIPIAF